MNFQVDFINKISLSSGTVADFVFFLAATVTTAITVILFYHWRKYTLKGKFMATMELVYLGVACSMIFF